MESVRPHKRTRMRRQLPRDVPRRIQARQHDLRVCTVAPELTQLACGIVLRGGGYWAGLT